MAMGGMVLNAYLKVVALNAYTDECGSKCLVALNT